MRIIITSVFLLPIVTFAYEISSMEFLSAQPILEAVIYWSTILVVIITTGMVFYLAYKMRGGAFNKALIFIGFGMIFLFVAYFIGEFKLLSSVEIERILGNILVVVGFMFFAFGSSRVYNAIKS